MERYDRRDIEKLLLFSRLLEPEREERICLTKIDIDQINTCLANLLKDSVDAKSVNHCSKGFAVRGPYNQRKMCRFFSSPMTIKSNHCWPKMCFVNRRWFSFGAIIDCMIFFFFTENYFEKFQNPLISILEKILTFETFMLEKTKKHRFENSHRMRISYFHRSFNRFKCKTIFHRFSCQFILNKENGN